MTIQVQGVVRRGDLPKEEIKLWEDVATHFSFLQFGQLDPRTTPGVFGKLGCLYIRTTDGAWFQKTGIANTAWTLK